MEVKSIPRLELIQVAEAVSREKSIDKEEVMLAMEEAIQKEDWTIVQELLNTIEMELEYENPFDQYQEEEMD